jgi:hypothetical protein
MMKDARWLLPFTYGLNTNAIDSILRQAKHYDATIVAVSLCTGASEEQMLFERNTQARVFLKTVQRVAEKYQVSVERYRVFTSNVIRSIRMLTSDLQCTSLVVVIGEKQGVLLSTQELRHLLLHEQSSSLVLIRLPVQKEKTSALNLATKIFLWFHRGQKSPGTTTSVHPVSEEVGRYAGKSG